MGNQLLMSHDEAMRQLGGIGRTTFYGLIEARELEQVHIGRRSFITAAHRVRGRCKDPESRGLVKVHRMHFIGWGWPRQRDRIG